MFRKAETALKFYLLLHFLCFKPDVQLFYIRLTSTILHTLSIDRKIAQAIISFVIDEGRTLNCVFYEQNGVGTH